MYDLKVIQAMNSQLAETASEIKTERDTTPRYVQVNIGRNIGDVPMPEYDWALFQGAVAVEIFYAAYDESDPLAANIHTGSGQWGDVREESAYVSYFAENGIDLASLRKGLEAIKARFNQDAIALITSSELI